MTQPPEKNDTSLYDAVGGEPTFRRLVSGFYDRIKTDDLLSPMYPEDDLAGAEDRLLWFLTQYWGGPRTYQERRGHPMLRRRHFPFHIDNAAAERWLELMSAALADIDADTIDDDARAAMWNHMQRVAYMMINA
ncbi:globin domain-containing protein [Corynebacterium uterequi]|uniref:Truncated hemoglobin n=1 Tax=Corynebacterium uterequi TaxID=1072256 RepID=A0A0G3HIF4_9CORY|nr:globin [Corynebacterium uterequi]AKK11683.1 truncated hemoglobin [Corynebacterium uterequi]